MDPLTSLLPTPLPTTQPPPQHMDPSPATAASDPAVHVAHVANPTPAATPVPSHPSYAEMIVEAINMLEDKDGSSKQAIAKYIDRVYSKSNLPATHSSLLTHHLKRLKDSGLLVMAKHSYKVATRSAPQAQAHPQTQAHHQTQAHSQAQANGIKRGRGRPPKAANLSVNSSLDNPSPPEVETVNASAGPGPITVAESVFASLGLFDGPPTEMKRRPGRPPKATAGVDVLQTSPVFKKSPGRPPKAKGGVSKVGAASAIVKKRGRPKKNSDGAADTSPQPLSIVAPPTPVDGIAAGIVLVPTTYGTVTGKKRGRPAKVGVGPNKKPRQLSGKPLGRPKKNTSATAGQVSNLQQLLAYQELKSKLEFFQSRIKQTTSLLKPCLGSQTPATALAALQELEELGDIDVTAPLNAQVQQQQQQPTPPPNQSS